MQPDGTFKTVNGMTLWAHPSSLMFVSRSCLHMVSLNQALIPQQNRKAEWVVFHELMETSEKTYIREITKIEKNWLVEYAPNFYQITQP